MLSTKQHTASQCGHALFLVLVAVILFAALSYAITQSERSGSDKGTNVSTISAAGIMEHSMAIQLGVSRLILRGISPEDIDFTLPDDINFSNPPVSNKVFHPQGGNVSYQNIDPNAVIVDANGVPLDTWSYLSTSGLAALPAGETAVAVLPGIRKAVCESINEKVTGSRDIPVFNAVVTLVELANVYIDFAAAGTPYSFLCITGLSVPDNFIYYHFF